MFGKDIDLGFLVYALPYIKDEQVVDSISKAVVKFAESNMSEIEAY